MKNLMLILIIFYFAGCGNYGEIAKDTIYLKFPIRVSLYDKNENWGIDSIGYGYPGNFKLIIKNVKNIEIYNLQLKGNFVLELDNDGERGFKEGDYYLFNTFTLISSKESLDSILKKIQKQDVLNYVNFCEESTYIIDMEHHILYQFFKSGHIYISDIKAIYERRLY